MPNYCVNDNEQPNGDHEVHDLDSTEGCLPQSWNRTDLGYHPDCHSALRAAQSYYDRVDGCAHCTPQCHRS